jgi:hypothetical protein
MDEYTVSRTSAFSAEIQEDIVLGSTRTTRKVLRAMIVRRHDEKQPLIKLWFIHQRKNANDEWEDAKDIKLSELKAGEGVGFELPSDYALKMFEKLEDLQAIAVQHGIRWGRRSLVVGEKGKSLVLPTSERKQQIEQLIRAGHGDDFWRILLSIHPEAAKKLSYAQIQLERERALGVFKQHLESEDWAESDWQKFFFHNQWIFGYGLRYQFIGIEQSQPSYGGESYRGTGKQKGDFLGTTLGNERFTVVVESKKPNSLLFDPEKKPYRTSVPVYSAEFIHAVSQAQVNARTWDTEGSQRRGDRELLAKQRINTITPRAILVIGNLNQLTSDERKQSFALFRRHLTNPDVLTFDELYERARYIVQQQTDVLVEEEAIELDGTPELTDEDIPF